MSTNTYAQWRKEKWSRQNGPKEYDFRRHQMIDGTDQIDSYLEPKSNFHFKDVIHCATKQQARSLLRRISHFKDVDYLEMRGSWVWVNYAHKDGEWKLPDQYLDDRSRVTGLAKAFAAMFSSCYYMRIANTQRSKQ